MSNVCIMLLTYDRFDYAHKTLRSTLDHVRTRGELWVHIASDGDTDEYINLLAAVPESYGLYCSRSNSQRLGYGCNYNYATQVVHGQASAVLVLEDDWELTRDLDLDVYLQALDDLPNVGCIRMGYLGYTQPLRGELASAVGRHWLLLDPESPEPHVFAGHPRLETVEWQRRVGPWPEGLEPGQTEFAVAHIPEARQGVVWPIQEVKPYGDLFVHIGARRSW